MSLWTLLLHLYLPLCDLLASQPSAAIAHLANLGEGILTICKLDYIIGDPS